MLTLRAVATRWIGDEPMPGLVEIEVVDADGRAHRIVEKSAVVDERGLLHRDAEYPIDVQIACSPRHQVFRPGETRLVNVVDLSPWGVGKAGALYPATRDQLSWAAPAAYSDLSIRARQGVALVTFSRWREAVGLDRPELAGLEAHLWEFALVTGEVFDAWHESHPLVRRRADEALPVELECSAAACGVAPADLRRAVDALVEITYGGLFGQVESEWSLARLGELADFVAARGIGLAPPDDFLESLWVDDAWGRPSRDVVSLWRALG